MNFVWPPLPRDAIVTIRNFSGTCFRLGGFQPKLFICHDCSILGSGRTTNPTTSGVANLKPPDSSSGPECCVSPKVRVKQVDYCISPFLLGKKNMFLTHLEGTKNIRVQRKCWKVWWIRNLCKINDMHFLNIASRISSDKVGSPSVTWLPLKKAPLGVTTFSENGGCLSSWRKVINDLNSMVSQPIPPPPTYSPPPEIAGLKKGL